ncbi:uncharacterized protein [Dermacentor albipictus]|uniref:uncharacterized protein isoform X2 n=1 Tax=Dermacentor albipictus TaxID=60249 RepID=UPI0031FCB0C7
MCLCDTPGSVMVLGVLCLVLLLCASIQAQAPDMCIVGSAADAAGISVGTLDGLKPGCHGTTPIVWDKPIKLAPLGVGFSGHGSTATAMPSNQRFLFLEQIGNVLQLIYVFVLAEVLEALYPHLATKEASALDWAIIVALIAFNVGSCVLSIGLIWGANSVDRGLLKKVVIGTKIRLIVLIFYSAFTVYVLSTRDPQDPLGIGKAKLIEHRSMGSDSWVMGKYGNLDPKTMVLQSINFLPGPHVLWLAQKNPDNKRTYKKHDKKDKEDEENKQRQKVQFLVYAVGKEIMCFFLELFIVYRLDLFVKSLPQ